MSANPVGFRTAANSYGFLTSFFIFWIYFWISSIRLECPAFLLSKEACLVKGYCEKISLLRRSISWTRLS